MAMPNEGPKRIILLYEWVKLRLYNPSGFWTSKTVRAVIAPSLCAPVILGTPFLAHNNIVIDHAARTVIDKMCGFDLLNPKPMVAELKMVCAERRCKITNFLEDVKPVDIVGAVRQRIEFLNSQEQLDCLSDSVRTKYKDVFSEIPHIDDLPTDVYCRIKLKDATKTVTMRSYSMPRKYKDAWAILIQQHLDVG